MTNSKIICNAEQMLQTAVQAIMDQVPSCQKHLADCKVPEKFIFLAEMPKSPTEEVHRSKLKGKLLHASVTTS